MGGHETNIDFSEAEKSYSSDSTSRRHSETDSDTSSIVSSIVEDSPYRNEVYFADAISAPLTPASTRATVRPTITRELSRFTTLGTTFTSDPSYEVDFDDESAENPREWSTWYKALVVFAISFSTLVVILYSTAYTAMLEPMKQEFQVTDETIPTLGVTTYLFGLAVGSLLLAPISETFGRRPVYVIALFCFFILVIPCALATSLSQVIIIRFFVAVAGSACIANAPGTIGDIVSDDYRALVFSLWSLGPMMAPVLGPVISGFVTQYVNWRWATWLMVMMGAVSFVLMACIRETYVPALLQQKVKKVRKETGDDKYWSRYDVKVNFLELMKVNLSRPFVMAVKEPICIFWNVYMGIIYGILYLCFVAYPIVYTEIRGWSISNSGLAFIGIGIGILTTISCASPIKKMIDSHKKDPVTGKVPPEAMMSVICIAAVLAPTGQLWFAWTCLPVSVHPAISIAAGIPFGAGNAAVFIYASNYVVHSYGIYAASAMAGNAVVRSVLGGTLPLAGHALYNSLGANWAGTLLGLLEVAIIPVPFIFYRYGHKIREKSVLIREMREIEEKQEAKKAKAMARMKRQQEREGKIQAMNEKQLESETELSRVEETAGKKEEV